MYTVLFEPAFLVFFIWFRKNTCFVLWEGGSEFEFDWNFWTWPTHVRVRVFSVYAYQRLCILQLIIISSNIKYFYIVFLKLFYYIDFFIVRYSSPLVNEKKIYLIEITLDDAKCHFRFISTNVTVKKARAHLVKLSCF